MGENFIWGGVAAGAAICVVNPIDVVKTRLQMQGQVGIGQANLSGPLQAFKNIAMREGVRGLYRGLSPAIMFQMVGNSTRFGVYYAGLTAGGLAGFIACPFFTLKTILQAQAEPKGLINVTSDILKVQGVPGLYAGLPAFILRCMALVGAQMTTYDWAKQNILDRKLLNNGPVCHMTSSAIAAGAAAFCMQPFDLIGARMMNQPHTDAGVGTLYSSPIDCFKKTVRFEGVGGLYKGGLANYARMAPQYILTFMFFEKFIAVSKELGWS